MAEKIVLGFSGGVDSSVAAELLRKQGYEVLGLYLDQSGPAALAEAVKSAEEMGIPLTVRDVSRELEELVCRPFAESYYRGQTPNPCILCNPTVKFAALSELADSMGIEKIATGHYARTANGGLYMGRPANDQSYMLCRLTREQVRRAVFPLGDMEKSQVRQLAEEMGLGSAKKPDSMEICFIPDKDYVNWLESRGAPPPEGDFVFRGQVIGRHQGIHRWTVGQRIPGLYEERKLYVSRICPEESVVELALWEDLFTMEVQAGAMNWLIDLPVGPLKARVKVRHTKWECPECEVFPRGDRVRIICREPLRAPAPGQAAVLYQGDRLIGGGFLM